MSMCLDLSLQVGLLAICIADLPSQKIVAPFAEISNALKSCLIHNSSEVRVANARYSTSAEFLATVACFFDFQLTKAWPK